MTEIKPVHQIFFDECTRWVDANEGDFELYDPEDTRILYPAAAYEALQKDLGLAKLAWESKRDLLTSCEAALEQSQADYAALQKENAGLKESAKTLDEMLSKVIDERNNAEQNMCKFRAEYAAQSKRKAELENELVEFNEFKKIRDSQMQELRKQMP